MKRFLLSAQEREHLFRVELIKAGVDFHQAAKVAEVLALNLLDEQLTPEEKQLVQNVCTQWLAQRKRMTFISQVLNQSQAKNTYCPNKSFKR